MHLTLTDRLTCPRCGPPAGLILMIERADERRVRSGALACPACRSTYPIVERVADLTDRPGGEGGGGGGGTAGGGNGGAAEHALRLAALLGLDEGSGFVVVDGPDPLGVAGSLGKLAPDFELVVPIGKERAAAAAQLEVSALHESGSLPLADGSMRGAAFVGGVPAEARLRELVRVCRPTGRVVLLLAAETPEGAATLDDAARLLEATGARVRARDARALVATVL